MGYVEKGRNRRSGAPRLLYPAIEEAANGRREAYVMPTLAELYVQGDVLEKKNCNADRVRKGRTFVRDNR